MVEETKTVQEVQCRRQYQGLKGLHDLGTSRQRCSKKKKSSLDNLIFGWNESQVTRGRRSKGPNYSPIMSRQNSRTDK